MPFAAHPSRWISLSEFLQDKLTRVLDVACLWLHLKSTWAKSREDAQPIYLPGKNGEGSWVEKGLEDLLEALKMIVGGRFQGCRGPYFDQPSIGFNSFPYHVRLIYFVQKLKKKDKNKAQLLEEFNPNILYIWSPSLSLNVQTSHFSKICLHP